MKRFFSICFLCALALCVIPCAASAKEAIVHESDDFSYTLDVQGDATITGWRGDSPDLTIPASLDGHKIVGIGRGTFNSYSNLKSVVIPEGVTSLGDQAFLNCLSLRNVTIPNSVTNVGDNPFMFCRDLTINVPDEHPTLSVIDGVLIDMAQKRLITYPFFSSVSEYTIAPCVARIGSFAFTDGAPVKTLTTIIIPESVTAIEESAFYGFQFLREIIIPNSVTDIEGNPFVSCPKLTISITPGHPTLSIIDGVLFDTVEKKLIAYPASLSASEYQVPEGTVCIADRAFSNASSLKKITIPQSVSTIGERAFDRCEALADIVLPDIITRIADYTFCDCASLTDIVLPNGVTDIGNQAFLGCTSLVNITIPNTVTRIGSAAFLSCYSLISLTIPDSVTSIGENAFLTMGFDDITLTVERGSYAKRYAQENNLIYAHPDGRGELPE